MILLISLFILTVAFVVIAKRTYQYELELLSIALSFVFGTAFFIAAVTIPISHYRFHKSVAQLEAFKQTVEASRKANPTDIERVAIMQQITEWNQQIAGAKYDNKGIRDLWIPDEIEEIEFIK